MQTRISTVLAGALGLLILGLGVPAPGAAARAGSTTPIPRVNLVATATDATGHVLYRRSVRLETLERPDVRIVKRTASSVTAVRAGAGADGPRATFRVRVVPGITDVVAHVRQSVPTFGLEGAATAFELPGIDGRPGAPVVISAYRLGATVSPAGSRRFPVDDIAAAQLRSRYFELRNALVELRVTGRTAVGANRFAQVPGLTNTVTSFSGEAPR